jgi:hypothetical protein
VTGVGCVRCCTDHPFDGFGDIDGQLGAVALGVLTQLDHVVAVTNDRHAQSAQIAGFGRWFGLRARVNDVVDPLGEV